MITTDSAVVTSRSWSAASHALCGRFFPIYWPHTTAPPVAIAVNMLISRIKIVSISDTLDTAASPTLDTIIESAMPTAMARSCSIRSGTISCFRSALENRSPSRSFR